MIDAKHVLICRNDAIGDMVLALPMCGLLKAHCPDLKITFLGTAYTAPVTAVSRHVDGFVDYDKIKSLPDEELKALFRKMEVDAAILMRPPTELAKLISRTRIRYRIGMLTWPKHWLRCNRFLYFSRSRSSLNEAQLNLKMLRHFGISEMLPLERLPDYYGLDGIPELAGEWKTLLDTDRLNLIVHPKTTGNGREWPLDYVTKLVKALDPDRYRVFITGSKGDAAALKNWLPGVSKQVTDLTGKLSLEQLMAFIRAADGLVAGSTGPVHLAAMLGIHALGLYTDLRSKNLSRWGPVGRLAEGLQCTGDDMRTISPALVLDRVAAWEKVARTL